MRYLVDTNVLIDSMRNVSGAIDFLEGLADDWGISSITAIEILVGARNMREATILDLMVSAYSAIPPNEDMTRRAYFLAKTYGQSHGLRTMDALIAATALEEGLTLVTRNYKHFVMIEGLQVQKPTY
jgi:predicted nucleic acid-binding protein